jgi:hypothetical protein
VLHSRSLLQNLDVAELSRLLELSLNVPFAKKEKYIAAYWQAQAKYYHGFPSVVANSFAILVFVPTAYCRVCIGLVQDMIMGGTDTTATTLEWCVLELVRQPEIQRKLREEIERVVGTDRRVEESDIPQLPYLQAFVKEIFRLHLPVPVTLPRLNDRASTLGGYDIPGESTIFVNTYAIAHDPRYWEDPEEFKPERFLNSNISLLGTDFELLPFGSGRRKCVGIQLGVVAVTRTTASLVQAFDWAPPPGLNSEDMDVTESYAIVLRKRVPLQATATPRPEARFYDDVY